MVKESLEDVVLAKESSQPQSSYEAAATLIATLLTILPKEVSNFATLEIQCMVNESLEQAVLAKESYKPQSSYEAAATLIEFELKKILIDKMDKSKSYLTGVEKQETRRMQEQQKVLKLKNHSLAHPKARSQPKSFGKSVQAEEPEFEVADSDMPRDQDENMGKDGEEPKGKTPQQGPTQNWLMTLAASTDKSLKSFDKTLLGPAFRLLKGTRSNYVELEYDFEECYKALSEKLDWENPKGGDYPFDLTKPLPLVMSGNRQKVPVDYFFNNDLKYLQGGVLTMTYMTFITKTKAAQYDLLGIEDMVPNIWVPIKVAYDKHALWGISHWREQRKTFYEYARGLESRHDLYSTKRILAVTLVKVMRKHGYGYLKEM
ncbi:hypothetical protein Tco_0738102 [Tanacetum coccineum]